MNLTWTEERIETLKRLWTEGYSSSCCARELGDTTRNACIGKLWRLGLKRGCQPTRNVKRRPRKQFTPKPKVSHPPQRKATVMDMPVSKRVVPTTAPVPKMLSIMQLTSATCRWPIGDPCDGMAYCGCEKDATDSYCSFHMGVAYMAPVDRATRAAAKLKASLRRAV